MRFRNYFPVLVSVLLVVGLVLPQAWAQSAPKGKPIELKAISFMPESNDRTVLYKKWLEMINARAKGELVIKFIGGPEAIPYPEQPQAIRKGVVDISFLGASRFKGLVPEARMMSLSLLPYEEEKKAGALELMRNYFAKANIYFIGPADPKLHPLHYSIYLMKEISTPDELKGMRLGANGTYVDAVAKAWNMSITVLGASDAYNALDRGMINGYAYALEDAKSYSLHEVVPCVIDHPLFRSNTSLVMNKGTWNNLPPHLQKLIMDVYEEYVPVLIKEAAQAKIEAKEVFKKAGVKFISFSPKDQDRWIRTCYEAEAEKYVEEMPKTGPEYLKRVGAIR